MFESDKLAAMRIMASINSTLFFTDANLAMVAIFKQIILSIRYDNAPSSAYSFMSYGIFVSGFLRNLGEGYRLGQIALKLVDKYDIKEYRSKVLGVTYYYINIWRHWSDEGQRKLRICWTTPDKAY